MHATVAELDFIEEIRLRCWARENYVAAHERDDDWHPVVLDEMRIKDFERGHEDGGDDDELIVEDELVVHNDVT